MDQNSPGPAAGVIATIENRNNPTQVVKIRYVKAENAFVTSGIQEHFRQRELMIPAHLVVANLQLIGAIVSAILERLSIAHETQVQFQYAASFQALGKMYTLTEYEEFMKLEDS